MWTKGTASRPPTAKGLADIGVTRAFEVPCSKVTLVLCNEFAGGGGKIVGNLH